MTIIKIYFLFGVIWGVCISSYFILKLIKNRQLRPVDSKIIITITLIFLIGIFLWPISIKYNWRYVIGEIR